jgi:hypothetical protein
MCVKALVRATVIAATVMSGLPLPSPAASAEAREFYTRKRVNGVWITGHFQRKRTVRTERPTDDAAARDGRRPPQAAISTAWASADDRPPLQRA